MEIELKIGDEEENLDLKCYRIENDDIFQATEHRQQHLPKSSRKIDRYRVYDGFR